jgi:tripartite-type tricarboxylate transporter receptor subunit TctC
MTEALFNPNEAQGVTPDLPTHSEDGVDLTLIRWMLSMTPAERLQTLQQTVESILRLRCAIED